MSQHPAFIFVRGGSKGILNKNLQKVGEHTLLALAIRDALQASNISRVIVSTDSAEIAREALRCGAEIPFMRPEELSGDASPEIESWKHALRFILSTEGSLPEVFVSVPATAPLRAPQDIDDCINLYFKSKCDGVVTMCKSARSPFFNLVKVNQCGEIELFSPSSIHRRQDAQPTYDLATVCYVFDPIYVLGCENILNGRVIGFEIPKDRAMDIDDEFDLEVTRALDKFRNS